MRTGMTLVALVALAGGCTTAPSSAPTAPSPAASRPSSAPSEPSPAAATEPTEATERSCPRPGEADAVLDWMSFVQVGPRTMMEVIEPGPLTRDDLGDRILRVECRIAEGAGTDYTAQSGDSAFLPTGTPVHALDGVDPGFRVVADDAGNLRLFEVDAAPGAAAGRDVFDVEGRVSRIDVTRRHVVDGEVATGEATDPTDVQRLVGMLLDAPTAPERQPSTNEVTYAVVLHLDDGPPLELLLYPTDDLVGRPQLAVSSDFTEEITQIAPGP